MWEETCRLVASNSVVVRSPPTRTMPEPRAAASHYPRLENGSSSHGTAEMSPEERDAVMSLRADWKFFALLSFSHTFGAVLKLPKLTADELGEPRVPVTLGRPSSRRRSNPGPAAVRP